MNNEKIKFRKVERKDLGEVFLLLQQLTEIDYSNRDEEDCWNKFNSNTSSNSIVGLYKDEVIAYGSLVVENKIRGEAAGHIEDIVVDNKVRGNNVGVMLIDELIKIGKEKECYRITLFCKEHLIKFYNKNGFEVNSMAMKLFPK